MIVATVAVSSLIGACAPAASTAALTGRRVTVPAIPVATPKSFTLSAASIEEVPCSACATGATPDPVDYFYSEVPLGSVDRQIRGTATDRRRSVGNAFVSGYFGGIQLRSTLGIGSADALAASTPVRTLLDSVGATTAAGIDSAAGKILDIAERGTDDQVRTASATWSAVLGAVQGYNRGYLAAALQRPPASSGVAPTTLSCAQFFECRSTGRRLSAIDVLAAQRGSLATPNSLQWLYVNNVLGQVVGAAVPVGQQVWNAIPGGPRFTAAAFRRSVDLSFTFLEITEAALLANLGGAAGGDLALARRGLVATASLVVLAGGYFLGLSSPLGNSAQPTVTCAA